ncbi:MAG: hypothetical protein C4547_10175 [Phycisphaerales bacterium]|nr:MAG: hypothetical protein C4547_10175 [Phycisphaerales bacterium]
MLISTRKVSKLFAAALMFAVAASAPAIDFDWTGQSGIDDSYDDPDNWHTDSPLCYSTCYPLSVSDNATFIPTGGFKSITLIDEQIGDFLIQQVDFDGSLPLKGIDDSSDVRELTVDKLTILGHQGPGSMTAVQVTDYARVRVR